MRRKFKSKEVNMLNRKHKIIAILGGVLCIGYLTMLFSLPVFAVMAVDNGTTVDASEEEFTSTADAESYLSEEYEKIPCKREPIQSADEEVIEEVLESSNSVAEEKDESLEIYLEQGSAQTMSFNFTPEERDMLAAIIWLEARGESFECQLAVGSVILNRLADGYWGDTLEEVLYARHQFSPAPRIKTTTPSEMQYQVVDQLMAEGPTIPRYVMYFRARYFFEWATPYECMGKTYFSYLEKDKQLYS